jgi:hypothetical protein
VLGGQPELRRRRGPLCTGGTESDVGEAGEYEPDAGDRAVDGGDHRFGHRKREAEHGAVRRMLGVSRLG